MAVAVEEDSKITPEYHETWKCGICGRSFHDATSCCAHEAQCGGKLSHC
jgi:hypothetical protein